MLTFVARRLGTGLLVLVIVLLLLTTMLALSPIDASSMFISPDFPPVVQEQIRKNLGLEHGTFAFAWNWLWDFLHFDLQLSLVDRVPVSEMILDALPNTLLLSALAMGLIFSIGCLIGIFQAVRQYTKLDFGVTITTLCIYSAPSFWLALMLIVIASKLSGGTWPIDGLVSPELQMKASAIQSALEAGVEPPTSIGFFERLFDYLKHALLPTIALGIPGAAGVARYMRSSMLEVIRQDYVRTARAKGVKERLVIFKHALRNALIPIITLLGLYMPFLVSGAVLVESIFSWPGMGNLMVKAVLRYDIPVILASTMMLTAMVVVGNLIADILYSLVDPRISHG